MSLKKILSAGAGLALFALSSFFAFGSNYPEQGGARERKNNNDTNAIPRYLSFNLEESRNKRETRYRDSPLSRMAEIRYGERLSGLLDPFRIVEYDNIPAFKRFDKDAGNAGLGALKRAGRDWTVREVYPLASLNGLPLVNFKGVSADDAFRAFFVGTVKGIDKTELEQIGSATRADYALNYENEPIVPPRITLGLNLLSDNPGFNLTIGKERDRIKGRWESSVEENKISMDFIGREGEKRRFLARMGAALNNKEFDDKSYVFVSIGWKRKGIFNVSFNKPIVEQKWKNDLTITGSFNLQW